MFSCTWLWFYRVIDNLITKCLPELVDCYQNYVVIHSPILAHTSGPQAGMARSGFTLITAQSTVGHKAPSIWQTPLPSPTPISVLTGHFSPLPQRVFKEGNSVEKSDAAGHTTAVFPPKNTDSTQTPSCTRSQAT